MDPAGQQHPRLVPRPYVDIPISIGRLRVLRGFQLVAWAVGVAWVFALALHSGLPAQRGISEDENALVPVPPMRTGMSQADVETVVAAFKSFDVDGAAANSTTAGADWFADTLQNVLGLKTVDHHFLCAGGQRRCRNVHSVLRSPHALGSESIVLAIPLPAAGGRRHFGAAVGLSVLRSLQRQGRLSRSVILLGYDAAADLPAAASGGSGLTELEFGGGSLALDAWLQTYFAERGQPAAAGDMSGLGFGSMHGRAGVIRQALVLDLDSHGSFAEYASIGTGLRVTELAVAHEGWATRMPNMDYVISVLQQLQGKLPRTPTYLAHPTLFPPDAAAAAVATGVGPAGGGFFGIGCNHNGFKAKRVPHGPGTSRQMGLASGLSCLGAALFRLASGLPAHPAAAFLTANIDAVSLVSRPTMSLSPGKAKTAATAGSGIFDVGTAIEGCLNTLNSLHEELHHSRPQYILLTPVALVEDLWYTVPSLIFLGNLLFVIMVYGYYVSGKNAAPAVALLSVAILAVPAPLLLFASALSAGWTWPRAGGSVAAAAGGEAAIGLCLLLAWPLSQFLGASLLNRFETSLANAAAAPSATAADGAGGAGGFAALSVEQLYLGLPERDGGSGRPSGRVLASAMVVRVGALLWLAAGIWLVTLYNFAAGLLLAASLIPLHSLTLPCVVGYVGAFPRNRPALAVELKGRPATVSCGKLKLRWSEQLVEQHEADRAAAIIASYHNLSSGGGSVGQCCGPFPLRTVQRLLRLLQLLSSPGGLVLVSTVLALAAPAGSAFDPSGWGKAVQPPPALAAALTTRAGPEVWWRVAGWCRLVGVAATANLRSGGVWVWAAIGLHGPVSLLVGKLHADRR